MGIVQRVRRSLAVRTRGLRRRLFPPPPATWEDRWSSDKPFDAHWNLGSVLPQTLSVLDRLPDTTRVTVDLGCGQGVTLAAMAERFPVAIGLDISPSATALARDAAPGSSVAAASAVALPLSAGSVDFLHDRGCYHTLPAEIRADYVDELCRVLAPRGVAHLVERQDDARGLLALRPGALVVESEEPVDHEADGEPMPMLALTLRRS